MERKKRYLIASMMTGFCLFSLGVINSYTNGTRGNIPLCVISSLFMLWGAFSMFISWKTRGK